MAIGMFQWSLMIVYPSEYIFGVGSMRDPVEPSQPPQCQTWSVILSLGLLAGCTDDSRGSWSANRKENIEGFSLSWSNIWRKNKSILNRYWLLNIGKSDRTTPIKNMYYQWSFLIHYLSFYFSSYSIKPFSWTKQIGGLEPRHISDSSVKTATV